MTYDTMVVRAGFEKNKKHKKQTEKNDDKTKSTSRGARMTALTRREGGGGSRGSIAASTDLRTSTYENQKITRNKRLSTAHLRPSLRAGAFSVSGWQTSSLSMRAIDVDNLISPRTESVSESRIRTEPDGMGHFPGYHAPTLLHTPPCSHSSVLSDVKPTKASGFLRVGFNKLSKNRGTFSGEKIEGAFFVCFSTSPCNKTLRVHFVFAVTIHSSGHRKRLLGSHATVTTAVAQTKNEQARRVRHATPGRKIALHNMIVGWSFFRRLSLRWLVEREFRFRAATGWSCTD